MSSNNDNYSKYEKRRVNYTARILESVDKKKVILAGPGTGKTHVFKQISKNIKQLDEKSNILALTFINELTDDLEKELFGLAEVHTLHRFALKQLGKNTKIGSYHLQINDIIAEDYNLINGNKIDFSKLFQNLETNEGAIQFYFQRQEYYNFYGPDSSVYALINEFEKNPDNIPIYDQILIDEYQDFNKLEIRLIQLLSTKSPILIVGDDDQSLYSFKYALPEEIINLSESEEYTSFELPYCSRCTRALIEVFNNFTMRANEEGYLADRVEKSFEYIPSKDKDLISELNPKIVIKQVRERQISYFINQEIKSLIAPSENHIKFLIVCPTNRQIKKLFNMLYSKGYRNIDTKNMDSFDGDLIAGFKLLLEDKDCNFGWRILSKNIYDKNGKSTEFQNVVKKSMGGENFISIVDNNEKNYIKKIRAVLNKISNNSTLTEDNVKNLVDCFDLNLNKLGANEIQSQFFKGLPSRNIYKDISIKITTILGSKGLTSDYVFLVNFDDRLILEDGLITDESIRKFLVVLTRARKRLYIYYNQNTLPQFVQWIPRDLIDSV